MGVTRTNERIMSRKNETSLCPREISVYGEYTEVWGTYQVKGTARVCAYTDKCASAFRQHPQYNGLVVLFTFEYSHEGSDHWKSASFYYEPLQEKFLDSDAFEGLCTHRGQFILRECEDLRYIPKLEDVCFAPEGVVSFARLFLTKYF
jgi:hypothetical protein